MLKQLKPLLIDFETTGLSPKDVYPTEVAVLKINDNDQDEFTSMIKLPNDVEIPEFITKLTGLTTDRVNRNGLSKGTVQSILKEFIDDQTLVIAHNANFDLGFLA